MNKVMRGQPDTLEEVFDQQEAILDILYKKSPDKPVVMATDSIAACSTKSEIEGDMDDQQMAPHVECFSGYAASGYGYEALPVTVCPVSVSEPGQFTFCPCQYEQFQFAGGRGGDDTDGYQYSYDDYGYRCTADYDGISFLPEIFRERYHDWGGQRIG